MLRRGWDSFNLCFIDGLILNDLSTHEADQKFISLHATVKADWIHFLNIRFHKSHFSGSQRATSLYYPLENL